MSGACLVFNYTGFKLPVGFLRKARRILHIVEQVVSQNFQEVNLVLVDKASVKYLNYTYRQQNKVTDVLSFAYTPLPVSGDLVICLEQARKQASRYRVTFNQELDKLLIHGFLHLLGYDHMRVSDRKLMRALENKIAQSL